MTQVKITITREKIFNGKARKPGFIILNGEIPDGIEPLKVLNAIQLKEVKFEVVEPLSAPATVAATTAATVSSKPKTDRK